MDYIHSHIVIALAYDIMEDLENVCMPKFCLVISLMGLH